MNRRIRELAWSIGIAGKNMQGEINTNWGQLEKFAMLVIQDYENNVRESRREVKSALGYSRIGRNNV